MRSSRHATEGNSEEDRLSGSPVLNPWLFTTTPAKFTAPPMVQTIIANVQAALNHAPERAGAISPTPRISWWNTRTPFYDGNGRLVIT